MMVHHSVNRGVEGGPGFDQDRNNYFMTKLMLAMYTMTICSLKSYVFKKFLSIFSFLSGCIYLWLQI